MSVFVKNNSGTWNRQHGYFIIIILRVEVYLLNELSPVRQLPGASTRARVEEIEVMEVNADRHIGYECYRQKVMRTGTG